MNASTGQIDHLSAEVIDGVSREYDFSAGGLEDWIVAFQRTDEEIENGDYEPMMNYLWPLPEGFNVPEAVKQDLDNMTVVEVRENPHDGMFLALTAGGMDLSWSIARTYVNLGLLPPASMGRLPAMADRPWGDADRAAVAALRKSNSLMQDRYQRNIDELDRLVDEED